MMIFSFNRAQQICARFFGFGFLACLVFFNSSMIHGIFALFLHSFLYASQAPVSLSNGLRCSISEGRARGTQAFPPHCSQLLFPSIFTSPYALCSYSKVTAPWLGWSKARTFSHPYSQGTRTSSPVSQTEISPIFSSLGNKTRIKSHLEFTFPADPSTGVHCPLNLDSVKHTQK